MLGSTLKILKHPGRVSFQAVWARLGFTFDLSEKQSTHGTLLVDANVESFILFSPISIAILRIQYPFFSCHNQDS